MVDELDKLTFINAMLFTTGADIDVINNNIHAAKSKKVAKWWHAPVLAMS